MCTCEEKGHLPVESPEEGVELKVERCDWLTLGLTSPSALWNGNIWTKIPHCFSPQNSRRQKLLNSEILRDTINAGTFTIFSVTYLCFFLYLYPSTNVCLQHLLLSLPVYFIAFITISAICWSHTVLFTVCLIQQRRHSYFALDTQILAFI